MNVELGTETPVFLFWEYLFQNFGILSLQCGAKFGICTIVSVNEALVNAKMCTFTLDSTHFLFKKCPIYTHDGTNAKFSTSWDETDYSVGSSPAIFWQFNLVVCIVNVFNRSSSSLISSMAGRVITLADPLTLSGYSQPNPPPPSSPPPLHSFVGGPYNIVISVLPVTSPSSTHFSNHFSIFFSCVSKTSFSA